MITRMSGNQISQSNSNINNERLENNKKIIKNVKINQKQPYLSLNNEPNQNSARLQWTIYILRTISPAGMANII